MLTIRITTSRRRNAESAYVEVDLGEGIVGELLAVGVEEEAGKAHEDEAHAD